MTHFHVLCGIPEWGLEWTDDQHATTADAGEGVRALLKENWTQDRARIKADGRRYSRVLAAYSRALVLSHTMGEPWRVEIPALDGGAGLVCGVVSCTDAHLRVVQEASA